jgi:hypothetical protein
MMSKFDELYNKTIFQEGWRRENSPEMTHFKDLKDWTKKGAKLLTPKAIKAARDGEGLGSGVYTPADVLDNLTVVPKNKKDILVFHNLPTDDPKIKKIVDKIYRYKYKEGSIFRIVLYIVDKTLVGVEVRIQEPNTGGSTSKIIVPKKWEDEILGSESDARKAGHASAAKEINKWRFN